MHACPECGKSMATGGGLDIHVEMFHAAPQEPEPEPHVHSSAVLPAVWPPTPSEDAAGPPTKVYAPMLRGYDPTLLLTAILIFGLLVAAVGSAIRRSGSSPVASVSAAGLPNSSAGQSATTLPARVPTQLTPTVPGAAPKSRTPLTQPPLFSQEPTAPSASATQDTSSCQPVVNSLSSRASSRKADAGELMAAHTFPGPPVPGASITVLDDASVNSLADVAAMADPADPNDQALQRTLQQAGFVSMHAINLDVGGTRATAVAFRFASVAGALTFDRELLTRTCAGGSMQNPHAIAGLTRGITFVDSTNDQPYGGTFVAGDTVLAFSSCGCAKLPDMQAVVAEWAQLIARRLGAA